MNKKDRIANLFNIFKNTEIVGMFIYQKGGEVVFANNVAAKIFGFEKEEEIIGKTFLNFIASHREEILNAVKSRTEKQERIQEPKEVKEYREIKIERTDGSIVWVDSFTYSINFNDKSSGLVILIDKTKEKIHSNILKTLAKISERLIEFLKESDTDSILSKICEILIDKTEFTSCLVCKKTQGNFEITSLTNKNSNCNLSKGRVEFNSKLTNKLTNLKEPLFTEDLENIGILKKSRKCNVHSLYALPIVGDPKHLLILLSPYKDVLKRDFTDILKEFNSSISIALSKIETEKEKILLENAIENSPSWFLITDENGVITNINKAVENISGYTKNELIGKKTNIFNSNRKPKEFYQKLWNTVKNGKIWEGIMPNKTKNGKIFYLDEHIIPVTDSEGKPFKFISIGRNITNEVLLKRKLKIEVKLYNLLHSITQAAIEAEAEEEFLRNITKILAETGELELAFYVDRKLNMKFKCVRDKEYNCFLDKALDIIKKAKEYSINLPVIKAIRFNRVYILYNFEKISIPEAENLRQEFNVGSCCTIPIVKKGNNAGAIVLISKHKRFFDKQSYKLLTTLKKQLSETVDKLEERKFHKIILSALDMGFDFVIVMNKEFNILYTNKTIEDFSGYGKEEIVGKHHSMFKPFKGNKDIRDKFYETLSKGKPFSGVLSVRKKNGTSEDFLTSVVPFKHKGEIEYYILVGKQLSNEKKLIEELNYILHYDRLTNLPSYNTFMESLERFIIRAKAEKLTGAIAIINPLSFKKINEALGFDAGNEALENIADRLKESVFKYDIVAKLESDRFGLLLKDLKQEENVITALTRIIKNLTESYNINGKNIHVSFNIGVSLYPKDGDNPKDLINKAQVALAEAKSKGENQIGFFRKDFEIEASKVLSLGEQLHNAVKNKEFVPFFQPYVDVKGKIVGAESLLRWRRSNTLISPMEFIPYLEQTDLIKHVEMYVLENVIRAIKDLEKKLPISVNMSTKSLNSPDLFQIIMKKIEKNKLHPSLLKIEIVERSFINNFKRLNELIKNFKSKGIGFSIDDFGTGYSSLSYLSKLSIESVKIDISFVRDITKSKHTRNIVESIIFLNKKLGIKTIAEGIERKEQFEILKDMGCDYFQGYLFYKPLPKEKFEKVSQS